MQEQDFQAKQEAARNAGTGPSGQDKRQHRPVTGPSGQDKRQHRPVTGDLQAKIRGSTGQEQDFQARKRGRTGQEHYVLLRPGQEEAHAIQEK
jgi:hypothetical protein